MAKVNSKKKNKAYRKRLFLIILSSIILISLTCTLFLGFKIHTYGREVTVIYAAGEGEVQPATQVVYVYKRYQLATPSNPDREFLYWSLDGTEKGKVNIDGIWRVSSDRQVVLYAVYGEEYGWTENY